MQSNIQKHTKLLIVSDTAMRRKSDKSIEAFEPVIREIENFYYLFDKITWIGYDYSGELTRKNMRKINNIDIEYIILPRTGGMTIWKKFQIIYKLFPYFLIINREIKKHDVIHTRAPSMPAFLAIIISFFDKQRNYWHKYAGNWSDGNAPIFYRFQRYLLKKAKNTHVTINGRWPYQSKHLLTFENPCMTEKEYLEAKKTATIRNFNGKLNFCFIGNLNDAKGVRRIIEAFSQIDNDRIGEIHFVGDGPGREAYKKLSKDLPVKFHGFLLRKEMPAILKEMHFLLLPSASEGFPKVVAEAASYGLVPIVSSVSSLPQYITHGRNGFLIDSVTSESLKDTIESILALDNSRLTDVSQQAFLLPKKFTYEYYNERIRKDILETDI